MNASQIQFKASFPGQVPVGNDEYLGFIAYDRFELRIYSYQYELWDTAGPTLMGISPATTAGRHNIGIRAGQGWGVWVDGTQLTFLNLVGSIGLVANPQAKFGTHPNQSGTAITLWENLCYLKSYNRGSVDDPIPAPGVPTVDVSHFDGPRVTVVKSPMASGPSTTNAISKDGGDAHDIAQDGQMIGVVELPNGRMHTGVVIAASQDSTTYTSTGTANTLEEPMPGVMFDIHMDAAGVLTGQRRISTTGPVEAPFVNNTLSLERTGGNNYWGVTLQQGGGGSPESDFPTAINSGFGYAFGASQLDIDVTDENNINCDAVGGCCARGINSSCCNVTAAGLDVPTGLMVDYCMGNGLDRGTAVLCGNGPTLDDYGFPADWEGYDVIEITDEAGKVTAAYVLLNMRAYKITDLTKVRKNAKGDYQYDLMPCKGKFKNLGDSIALSELQELLQSAYAKMADGKLAWAAIQLALSLYAIKAGIGIGIGSGWTGWGAVIGGLTVVSGITGAAAAIAEITNIISGSPVFSPKAIDVLNIISFLTGLAAAVPAIKTGLAGLYKAIASKANNNGQIVLAGVGVTNAALAEGTAALADLAKVLGLPAVSLHNAAAGSSGSSGTASGGKAPVHHVATDKHTTKWTEKFKKLFDEADVSMQDPANKIEVPGHCGPHSEQYHQYVFDEITKAFEGLTTKADKAVALRKTLKSIGEKILNDPDWAKQMGITK